MRAERIFFMCSSVAWAGTEKWALRAAEEISSSGRKVTFVARAPEVFRERQNLPLDIKKLPLKNDGDLLSILSLSWLLKKEKADVLIVTRVRDYWLGGLAGRLAGVPVLLRLGVVRKLRQRHFMDYFRYGVLPSKILVNAQAIKETLKETPWVKSDDINVIYNGVDVPGPLSEEKIQVFRNTENITQDKCLIVGAGRLAVEKRWRWLIEAVYKLHSDGKPVVCYILGEGNERHKLEEMIKQFRLEGVVHLPGYKKDANIWLGAADIVALPSDNEGISNTMLETMGMATPVVVTASGGVREHFSDGNNLFLADTNDFDGFYSRTLSLVSDPTLRKELGLAGLEKVKSDFQWNSMTKKLQNLLDGMVGSDL